MRSAEIIARENGIETIAVVSKADFDGYIHGLEVIQAPKKFATLLDSMIHYFEESTEKIIAEKFSQIYRTKEYISSYMYLKGFEIDRAVVVIDTEMLKGITIFESEKSAFLKAVEECVERIDPEALRAVLTVAINIAHKGREGRKIGTAFVIGDVEEVMSRSSQLIINPYEGHREADRDIKNPENWESVMEFAQIDGVFVLDEKGIIISCGRYIEASARDLVAKIRRGLGGRHIACASITKETEAIAVVVSETGGDITVYKDGVEVIHIPSLLF
ncbi:DNA integrity scanning protein DisA nucleotide-binding domain protein [Archaeoglobus neptunius]|uniref:DNA integrity scanning protein DisA nucleotide-binding domain protein n=1 Tax=Archaeoglobus neptunius TaxID=2798580 RepID=UPI001E39FF54|nr:diadenylate cyclase [Archaeoglobus neptunius]